METLLKQQKENDYLLLLPPDADDVISARSVNLRLFPASAAEFPWRKAAEQTKAVYRHVTGAPGKSKVEPAYRHHVQGTRD
jgi:hypothetical protein